MNDTIHWLFILQMLIHNLWGPSFKYFCWSFVSWCREAHLEVCRLGNQNSFCGNNKLWIQERLERGQNSVIHLKQAHTISFSHWWQVTGWGEMASSCARASLGWTSEKTCLQKRWLSTGIGSPGRWLSHHPWMCLKTVYMWCSGTWFSRGLLELG